MHAQEKPDQITQPLAINWEEEEKHIVVPDTTHTLALIDTVKTMALSSTTTLREGAGQAVLLEDIEDEDVPGLVAREGEELAVPLEDNAVEHIPGLAAVDPFMWWSAKPAEVVKARKQWFNLPADASTSGKTRKRRRTTIALVASGAVAVLGAWVWGFEYAMQQTNANDAQSSLPGVIVNDGPAPIVTPNGQVVPASSDDQSTQSTTPAALPTSTSTPIAPATPTTATTPVATPTTATTPVATPTTATTPALTPTATPGSSGPLIGNTSQPTNSATTFTTLSGGSAFLLHLANGNFVAYPNSCTHQGASLRYDPATQRLLCTRHSAAFDPANNGVPLYGPPSSALSPITIHVHPDGTITA